MERLNRMKIALAFTDLARGDSKKWSEGEPRMRTLDGSQYFYLYFELTVYLAVMNGHYMLIELRTL